MIIQSKKVWISGNFIPAQIEIVNDKIVSVYAYGSKEVDIDYEAKRITPGFIDIHTHGGYGFDTNDGDRDALINWIKNIPADEGVTGVLPTTITQSVDILTNALKNVANVKDANINGAEILGVHFEGPYLSVPYKGAQPEQFIVDSNVEQFKMYQEAANGLIKVMTMACEKDEDHKLTKYASNNGVVVSIGHSGSTFEEAQLAVANGATSMTHVYNGMTPFHHRNIGLIGAALRFRDVYGEVVVDGCHCDLNAVNMLFASKGRDYTITITDSLRAKGLAKGKYLSGGLEMEIFDDGSAHLMDEKRTLAGSTLKMNQALKILIEDAQVAVDAAINSITLNPARLLKVDNRVGKICSGYDANIVVLNDDYSIEQTYVKGLKQK